MNYLVKIIKDDDGFYIDNPKWHLIDPATNAGYATFCKGEFFGSGESECEYELKQLPRGGITCEWCLEKLKTYKKIRL